MKKIFFLTFIVILLNNTITYASNLKSSMRCINGIFNATIHIENGKIIEFYSSYLSDTEIGEWKIEYDKSDLNNYKIHVKAINTISNTFNYYEFDFKNNTVKTTEHGHDMLDKCEKKLEL